MCRDAYQLTRFIQERARILNRMADLMEEHKDELSALDTLNMGKVYDFARLAEAPLAIGLFRYYAGRILRISQLISFSVITFLNDLRSSSRVTLFAYKDT